MKRFYQHPQFKRWGMYSVLLASLGFTVSMNPSHFNNIARNDYSYQTFQADFAATAPSAIEFKTSKISDFHAKNGRIYDVSIVDYETSRRVVFSLKGATEAQGADCSVCGRTFEITAGIDDKKALIAALDGLIADSASESPVTPLADVAVAAEGQSRQYLEDWAKPCLAIKEKTEKMSCHSDRLIALSNTLEDDSNKGSIVLKYFQKYLKSSLRSAFSANFYRVRSSANGLSSISRDEKADELNDAANEIYERIVAELKPENGEKTRKDLWSMYRGAFGKQAENSLALLKQGYQSGNMQLFQLGASSLRSLQSELDSLSSVTMDQLADVNSENSMEDLFAQTLQNPVASYLRNIYQTKDLINYQLPPLTEDVVVAGSGSDIIIDSIHTLEQTIANRARAVRGENQALQQQQVPTGVQVRQGIYLPNGVGSQMMPQGTSPFPSGQGVSQPIPAGVVLSPAQRGGR